MEETIIEKNGFKVKALTNSCEIKPFVQLQVYKAASKKDAITPLEGATLVTDDVKTLKSRSRMLGQRSRSRD